MNVNGKIQSMFAVRQAESLKFGVNKSRTLAEMVKNSSISDDDLAELQEEDRREVYGGEKND